mmetsp:Transcript_47330/g.110476  ORF Transcript_47330/g.110476 Transcript_47330/m.110476 type:complete len:603 (+) Transcript_47330:239-2047(+)
MVISDVAKISLMIVEAAKLANVRLLVQSNWSVLTTAEPSGGLCFDIGPCPHDWLLPQVSAVVHHGGAGTTAAGLRAGKPTLVCPFFGDQFFWGEQVRRAGVGPAPCPIGQLTAALFAEKLHVLTLPETNKVAQALAMHAEQEDGVAAAVRHWEKWLPRQAWLCDASLLLPVPEHKLARFRLGNYRNACAVKLCSEAVALMKSDALTKEVSTRRQRAGLSLRWLGYHRSTKWGIARLPGFFSGVIAGVVGFVAELVSILWDVVFLPDDFARRGGCICCIAGVLLLPLVVVLRALHAILILADRLVTGAYNSYVRLRDPEDGYLAMRDFILDPYLSIEARRAWLRSLKLEAVDAEVAGYASRSAKRAAEMLDAVDLATRARTVYESEARGGNLQVATEDEIRQLAKRVRTPRGLAKLDASEEAAKAISDDLAGLHDFCSFTMFCVILQQRRAEMGHAPRVPPANSRSLSTLGNISNLSAAPRVERLRGGIFGSRAGRKPSSWLPHWHLPAEAGGPAPVPPGSRQSAPSTDSPCRPSPGGAEQTVVSSPAEPPPVAKDLSRHYVTVMPPLTPATPAINPADRPYAGLHPYANLASGPPPIGFVLA